MSDTTTGVNVYKERIYPVLFMAIITIVFIAMVSGIYLATRDLVLLNESLYLKRAVLFAAGVDAPDSATEAEGLYNERVREQIDADGATRYYVVEGEGAGGSISVIPMTGPGLWGEIEAVIGLDQSLKVLTGVDFTRQNETPGLGARISEEWFRKQFRGKTGPFTMVPEGTDGEGRNEFDAITGATITSTAVKDILNKALKEAPEIVR